MVVEPSDREILLQLRWQMDQVVKQLNDILPQLAASKLFEQRTEIGMSTMASNFSRSMLLAEEARKKADEGVTLAKAVVRDLNEHLKDVEAPLHEFEEVKSSLEQTQLELARWKSYLKVIGIILAPIQAILIAIAIELIKRGLISP